MEPQQTTDTELAQIQARARKAEQKRDRLFNIVLYGGLTVFLINFFVLHTLLIIRALP
ncbi:MAG: hypothetical protein GDA55_01170 [Cellvibrionales bacterium]|nr:hypothetical protein [Cellvibrionales bacterium]